MASLAAEDRLKMRPDIMMVDLTTNDLSGIESRAPKKRKANGEQTTLQDTSGRTKTTIRIPDTKTSTKLRFSNTNHYVRSLKTNGTR